MEKEIEIDSHDKSRENHLLNAMGPYNHGVWENDDLRIGDEEALTGRAQHIIDTFVKTIKSKYSESEIANLSLLDIGCYDGYLAINIEKRLNFKRIVGVEPREKNIEKGETVRRYLGLKTKCEFKVGDIDSVSTGPEEFDIVFCSGVFHHLIEIDSAIKKLKQICKKMIFIETQCYEPLPKQPLLRRLYDRKNERIIEPKDVVYKFVPKSYGLSGHKFETNYYDGSANGFSLVTIPSPQTVCMALQSNGFSDVEIVSDPLSYKKAIKSNLRDFFAVCISAGNNATKDINNKINGFIENYEEMLLRVKLNGYILESLKSLHSNKKSSSYNLSYLIAKLNIKKYSKFINTLGQAMTKLTVKDKYQLEILNNIKYKPEDKIQFEEAKNSLSSKDYELAKNQLLSLVGKINTDWRVTYRSFCLLALLYKQEGDSSKQKYYRDLCLKANSNYPANLLDGSLGDLFP